MAQEKKKIVFHPQKFYFVYFIIFSVIILIIFSFIIIGSFWDYSSEIKRIENFYSEQAKERTALSPKINPFDPIRGIPEAKVTIFEYSDFFCPACQALQNDLTAVEKFYGNNVRFIFKGLPITANSEAKSALEAAYCAGEQNKFWEYKDLLFQNPLLLNQQKYREYANQLNLNLDQFNQCLSSNQYEAAINKNLVEALSLQINSVPTLFVDDQKVEGYISSDLLRNIIDQKLK